MALPNIEVLTTPMPEDVIYFLDCGSEYGELSIVDNYALSLWGDRVVFGRDCKRSSITGRSSPTSHKKILM
jgi:hypothetical protein